MSDVSGVRRAATVVAVADAVVDRMRPHGVLGVGIDGVDGGGKTVFADELADVLERRGIAVVRASVDGFHNPAEVRYRKGRSSPAGFFLDSYDYGALRQLLLEPLLVHGESQVVRAVYDVHAEAPVDPVFEPVGDAEVLVFDGIFLHREELRDLWGYSVFLDVRFEVSIPRGAGHGYGDPDLAAPSNRRYVEGQRLYLRQCEPQRRASCVIDNNDLADAHIADGRGPST